MTTRKIVAITSAATTAVNDVTIKLAYLQLCSVMACYSSNSSREILAIADHLDCFGRYSSSTLCASSGLDFRDHTDCLCSCCKLSCLHWTGLPNYPMRTLRNAITVVAAVTWEWLLGNMQITVRKMEWYFICYLLPWIRTISDQHHVIEGHVRERILLLKSIKLLVCCLL